MTIASNIEEKLSQNLGGYKDTDNQSLFLLDSLFIETQTIHHVKISNKVRIITLFPQIYTVAGTCSVMVIIVENGNSNPFSNPGQGSLHFV